ncbi:hypothetical protein FOA43_001389 [Brettanomyces nanus]|uniref:Uncharacterized protein n=1 Tax=Eeniella nana TaxID=13502 RepID=A0A875RZB7_EENNA|nr:uncharacterized protein FOA43_001389 [Brettanomyces nanus]QPG74068.1 hypothetical protein FOA43_001389 [Brettanomyces nanus]
MSLRGVKKALYRTPHQIFGSGNKTVDDRQLKAWEHDINNAIAGLEFLQLEAKKWQRCWIDIATTLLHVIGVFSDIHKPLDSSRKSKSGTGTAGFEEEKAPGSSDVEKGEQFTYITHHELAEAYKLVEMLFQDVSATAEYEYDSVADRCKAMKDNLKAISKLITKRNHKKIDYDMSFGSLEKAMSSRTTEALKVVHSQSKMEQSKEIYLDLDSKVRIVLPPVLETLSEFLNKMAMKIYYGNVETLRLFRTNLRDFAQSQGLLGAKDITLDYATIVTEFGDAYSIVQNRLESLEMLQEYKRLKETTLKDKAVDGVGNVTGTIVGTTVGVTSSLYTRASKSGQKLSLKSMRIENPVKPFDKGGMFATATDPVKYELQSQQNDEKRNYEDESSLQRQGPPPVPLKDFSTQSESIRSFSSHGDADWLRPLSLKSNDSPMPPIPNSIDSAVDPVQHDGFNGENSDTTTLTSSPLSGSRRFSFNLVENSETAKYISVGLDQIRRRIRQTLTTPNISTAPLTFDPNVYAIEVKRYGDMVLANSSISAQLFKSSLTANNA